MRNRSLKVLITCNQYYQTFRLQKLLERAIEHNDLVSKKQKVEAKKIWFMIIKPNFYNFYESLNPSSSSLYYVILNQFTFGLLKQECKLIGNTSFLANRQEIKNINNILHHQAIV